MQLTKFRSPLYLIFGLCLALLVNAQDRLVPRRTIQLPVAEWLSQGERQDFPWQVRITKPELTFQQRMLVTVSAEISSDHLQRRSINRDLHFLVKVADENGRWMDEESYTPYRLDAKLDGHTDLQMQTELYLQPGTFTIATIAYDSVLGERDLSFTRIKIDPIEKDFFPELLSRVPRIQLLPSPVEGLLAFGRGRVNLPVVTQRPVQFDLIVDLSTYDDQDEVVSRPPLSRRPPPGFPRRDDAEANRRKPKSDRTYIDRLIQSASVLSQLHLDNGCTRVTAMDVLRRRMILPTTAEAVDWQKIRGAVLGPDRNLISVSDLGGKREAPAFFAEQLEKVMSPETQCGAASAKPVHVVAVLAHGVHSAWRSTKIKAQGQCGCEVFYLKQGNNQGGGSDDLKGVLSPLSPKILEFKDPLEFRHKLADLVQTVEKASALN